MSPVTAEAITTTPHLMFSTKLVSELGEPRSGLRATTDRRGPALLIYAGGDVDASNEHTWRQLVDEAAKLATAPGPFVVDVTGLDFMACCAFAVLADTAERCLTRGVEMRLVTGEPIVRRIVDACGLSSTLPIYPTVDHAVSAPMLRSAK
jgi:anti-anti-sigma factor